MARFLQFARVVFKVGLIFFQLVYFQNAEIPTKNQIENGKAKTLFDFYTRVIAYKDLMESKCYLELMRSGVVTISDLNYVSREGLVKTLLASENQLTKQQVWNIGGTRVLDFCRGYPTFLLQQYSQKNGQSESVNEISTDSFRKNRRRRSAHYFRGRIRGQTQSQYLSYGGNNQQEGKAEAESTYDGSKAVVVSSNGMGSAQSQSSPLGCEECFRPGTQEQVLHFGRGEIKVPGYGQEGATITQVKPGGYIPGQIPAEIQIPGTKPHGIPSGYVPGQPQALPSTSQLPQGPPVGYVPGQIQTPGQIQIPGQIQTAGQIQTPAHIQIPGQYQVPLSSYTPGQTQGLTSGYAPGQLHTQLPTGQPQAPQLGSEMHRPSQPVHIIPSGPPVVNGHIPGRIVSKPQPGQYTTSGQPDQGQVQLIDYAPQQRPVSADFIQSVPGKPSDFVQAGTPEVARGIPQQKPGESITFGRPGEYVQSVPGRPGEYVQGIPTRPGQAGTPEVAHGIPQKPEESITFGGPGDYIQSVPGRPGEYIQSIPGRPGQFTQIVPGRLPGEFVQRPERPGEQIQVMQKPGQYTQDATRKPGDVVQGIPGKPGTFIQGLPGRPGTFISGPQGQITQLSDTRRPGEFSGNISGQYQTNVGQGGRFSGVFSGRYGGDESVASRPIDGTQLKPVSNVGSLAQDVYSSRPGIPQIQQPGLLSYQPGTPGSAGYTEPNAGTLHEAQGPPQRGVLYGTPGAGVTYGTPETPATLGAGALYGAGPSYQAPSTRPSYAAPGTGQSYAVPGAGPSYTGPSTVPSYAVPGAGPSYVTPSTGPSYATPGIGPPYAAPSTGLSYTAPGTSPTYAAPGTGPSYTAPGTGPTYTAPGTGSSYAAQGTGPSYASPGTGTSYGVPGGSGPSYTTSSTGPSYTAPGPSYTAPAIGASYSTPGVGSIYGAPGTGTSYSVSGAGPSYGAPGSALGTVPSYGTTGSTTGSTYGTPELGLSYESPGTGLGSPYAISGATSSYGAPGSGVPGSGLTTAGQVSAQTGNGPFTPGSQQTQYGPAQATIQHIPANLYETGSGISDDADSQAQTSVQQINNETQASASAQGRYQGGQAQSQVSGSYHGTGSFSASAGTNDGKRGAQTEVSGGKEGAISTAQGTGGMGSSQAQVQLASESGDTVSTAQSGGYNHGSNSQVQASSKGGMADAQANGPGSTSSQAQIGFIPNNNSDDDDQKVPFRGGGTASAQSGTHSGQTQTQIQGKFRYGIKYTGAAQAASGNKESVHISRNQSANSFGGNFPAFKPLKLSSQDNNNPAVTPSTTEKSTNKNQINVENPSINVMHQRNIPMSTPRDNNEDYDDDYDDYEEEEENGTEKPSTKSSKIISQTNKNQKQHIVLDPLEDIDATVLQASDDDLPEGTILQPGQIIPGFPGYQIPLGFRGRVSSSAGTRKTVAIGHNSQAQSVTLKPGIGRVIYNTPVYAVSSNTHLQKGGFGFGSGYTYHPTRHQLKSGQQYPNFVSVAKSETGSQNIYTGKKTPSVYYTQSSSCGYFTNTCIFNKGSKICIPKPKTNPDGSPIVC